MQISQRVCVRGARWRIVDIRTYQGCQLVTLAGTSPHGVVQRQVLAPFDDIDIIAPNKRPRFARAGAWWRACRTLLADDAPPGSLRSVAHARIDIMPHQLEPALAIVRGLGSRVLIADEVGLGKTIQAGIIVSELRTRRVADRVLVIAPAGLRDQWVHELSIRFGLEAHLADAPALRRLSATLPLGVNPWTTRRIAVTSIDYVKRPEVLPTLLASPWDVLIVDEAHGAAGDSDRQAAVAAIAARTAYVVLLTATPHSGDARSFASLCRFGAAGDDLVVFRRRRADVRSGAVRKIHTLQVRPSAQELQLHARLERYVAAVRAERDGAWLAASVLHKRALSSAWSLARSVERRLNALADSDRASSKQPGLPFGDADGEFTAADDEPGWPAGVGLSDVSRESRLLRSLLAAAQSAATRESKLQALARLLSRADEPAIVFTEYRDTLRHVREVLRVPSAVLHGGLTRAERAAAIADFVNGSHRVLLATDAGAEGLNLHHACRLVVNLELPWNPMRLEQRIGRVDRIGQRCTVHAFHLVSQGTGETRILARLKLRVARACADIGAPDPVGDVEERAVARLVVLGIPEAESPPDAIEPAPRVMPDLREEAEREARRLTFARLLIRGPANRRRQGCGGPPTTFAQGDGGPPKLQRRRKLHAKAEAGHYRFEKGRSAGVGHYRNPGIDADGPWIHRARRASLRAALGRRVLMLWRIACEDGCGRTVDSLVIPVIVGLKRVPSRWTWRSIDNLRQHVEGFAFAAVAAPWRNLAQRSNHAFLSTRLSREHAIQAQIAPPPAADIQPGLFDRRAGRARLAALAIRTDVESELQHRLAALELATALSTTAPQLLLVLLP
jgi:superfamily II DNA or RNA helicase